MTAPLRILLVEDSLQHTELIREFLRLRGSYELDAVTHVADIWPLMKSHSYDAVLLDYSLPDGTGLDVLQQFAAQGLKTPTVMITGHGDERVAASTVKAGAAEYVVKTGNYFETLPEVINRVIEQGRLERALDEAKARYRDLFEQASEGILLYNAGGIIIDANPALFGWVNYRREALVGQHISLIDPEAGKRLLSTLSRHETQIYECEYRRSDGSSFPAEVSARLVPSSGKDRSDFVQLFVRDITRRKQMETEIGRQTRMLAALSDVTAAVARSLNLPEVIDAALDGLTAALDIECGAIYTPQGGQLIIAPSSRGLSRQFQQTMSPLAEAEWLSPRRSDGAAGREEWMRRENVLAYLSQPLMVKGKIAGLVLLASRKRHHFAPDDADFVRVNSDRISAAIENAMLYRDLQNSMEALRQAQAQLVRAARFSAVGELAAGVAHQINNPLTTVIADAQLLMKTVSADEAAHASANAIFQAGWRAQRVVQRLLNFSRPDEGLFAPTDINATVVEALDLVGAHVERGGVELRLSLAPNLPPAQANDHQLEEIWINLLMNARDALVEGRPGLIRVESQAADSGDAVEVCVRDNGHGIAPEDRESIFTPFFTTKEPERGNGLGLSVCQSIIRNHGGEITFDSQPGEGARFTVRLPLIRKAS
ncbi:MAG: response regulator [Chloroflexi bacterium]|nr:response regulator [Chloroflexota bacterium]